MMTTDISIIIVNYNVQYFIEQCLNSIYNLTLFNGRVETIVVDNNSNDGSVQLIKQSFPQVKLIENEKNVGFSVANNQGIQVATGKYILLLNPDTLLSEDTLTACFSKMEADSNIGALGVRMVDGSGNFLPESKRGFPTPAASFYRFSGIHKLFPKSKKVNAYYQGHIPENTTAEIEILCGAFMFMSKDTIAKVGALDEDFFMYGEDIDLSYRIRKAGYKIIYFPETSIVHFKGESTKKSSVQYTSRFYNAMDIFARKHFQDSKASSFLKYLSIVIWLKAGLNYLMNFAKKLVLPLLDIAALFGGLLLISEVWARYYFGVHDYYASAPLTFNFIIYTLIYFVFILFGGGYDQKISLVKLLRNILLGTLTILAFYALLSPAYRSSRAIIVLAAAYAVLVIPLFRYFLGPMLGSSFHGLSSGKRIIILAHEAEAIKIENVLKATNKSFHNLERLPVNVSSYELREIVQLKGIDEIICNVRDVGMSRIIELMSELGSRVSFKITGDESLGIIGSQSKNKSGEIYTLEINYDIQSESSKRNKRTFDISVSVGLFLLFPLALLSKTGRSILKNISGILLGNKTLIGYGGTHTDLPLLSSPIFSLGEDERTSYAKHYTIWKDFRYLWKAIANKKL